mmetsp:Transcript_4929/g.6965  ORF Transcript_4929/g.6965 Transcript_4929/m.6965 type:complete len:204 (+) Transcript_4929:1692-2303(+)
MIKEESIATCQLNSFLLHILPTQHLSLLNKVFVLLLLSISYQKAVMGLLLAFLPLMLMVILLVYIVKFRLEAQRKLSLFRLQMQNLVLNLVISHARLVPIRLRSKKNRTLFIVLINMVIVLIDLKKLLLFIIGQKKPLPVISERTILCDLDQLFQDCDLQREKIFRLFLCVITVLFLFIYLVIVIIYYNLCVLTYSGAFQFAT